MKVKVFTENENSLGRGKKLYVGLFDFLAMFLTCVIIFVIFLAIFQSSSTYSEMSSAISSAEKELAEACVDTKLTRYDSNENGTSLASMESVAVGLVKSQVLARFILDSDERALDPIFTEIEGATPENDPCYYYLKTYKTEHASAYSKESDCTLDVYLETLKRTEKFGDEEYPVVTITVADEIFNYLKGTSSQDTAYSSLKNTYDDLVNDCVGDFMNNCEIYNEKQEFYGNASEKLYKTYIYALLVAYLLSMIVFYLVMPLVLKEGRTIFVRLFKMRCQNVDAQDVTGGQVVIRFFCQLVLYLFTPLLILLISMDISTFSVIIFVRFLRFFNLLTVGTLAFVLTICNMLFTFYSKKKKQTIAEFISKIVTVEDKRVKTVNLSGIDVEIK